MKMISVYNFLVCISVVICCVEASSIDELKQEYANMIMECAQQYPPTQQDLEQLKMKQISDSETVKCLIACAYKKTGMMDDKGMLSVEGTNKLVEKYYADDPEEVNMGKASIEACKNVNDQPVSDGDKGCDRAVLLFQCAIDNMPGMALDK